MHTKVPVIRLIRMIFYGLCAIGVVQCHSGDSTLKSTHPVLLSEVPSSTSHIDFENKVVQNGENNVLNYSYYFNGGGVAVFDINNDGLQDIYFTGNTVSNKLYLNKGALAFEDITDKAGVACNQGWKTGVTVVDINQDGWLDFYVCRSAMGDSILRKNLLFINNKDLTFTERAAEYGLDHQGYSTQAAFFDYDQDGDQDMFLLNHSLPAYTKFNNLKAYLATKGSNYASRLMRNDQGKFKDVSDQAGIANNVLSFGLGIAIADLNQDGWLDVYVSNDFNEQDYMYLNNHNGTFHNGIKEATGHISLFSMGSDVADINNDGLVDLMTLDMMPISNDRIKLSSGDDNYDKNQVLERVGLHHQTMRNMLHLNNGDGTYSEIGQLAGVSNTDWSWASLFTDLDGDGYKDLYISNGYEKDFTNMQFLKFTMDARIKSQQTGQSPDMNLILNNIPSIEEGNFIFKNNADTQTGGGTGQAGLTFSNYTSVWSADRKFKSNGAAYADLDNDGDPDLVINAMNQKSFIYKNNTVEQHLANFLSVDVSSSNPGIPVTGTQIKVYHHDSTQLFVFSPTRGFQSCMYSPLTVGVGSNTNVDSLKVIWPNQNTQLLKNVDVKALVKLQYKDASPPRISLAKTQAPLFVPTKSMIWNHQPVDANDFKQQALLPRMYSCTGPKMIAADVNRDGLQDIFICAPANQASSLFIQNNQGRFESSNVKLFEEDQSSQDENACFFDADQDGDLDLYVVSGGYHSSDPVELQDRLYFNDGKGVFNKAGHSIPQEKYCGSVAVPIDIDGDGDMDLFIGNRMTPGQYPLAQPNQMLINDGKGNFTDQIKTISPSLEIAGLVTDAKSVDLNKDGATDLILVGEWMNINVWINNHGKLTDRSSDWIQWKSTGWWNTIDTSDFDRDGDIDLIVGNAGENNQYHVSPEHPVTLMYKDFDHNGQVDPFLCYFIGEISYPYASRDEALGQVGFLRNRFLDYNSYAPATINQIFTPDELKDVTTLKAESLQTVYLENKGNSFQLKSLPIQAQYAPVYSIVHYDIDLDGDQDIILGGNETKVRVRLGRSDANKGFVFINDGKGNFSYLPQVKSGLNLQDDTRQLLFVSQPKQTTLFVGQYNKPVISYKLESPDPLK